MIEDVYAALVAGDGRVAASCEPVRGGVRLRLPDLPAIRDYNAVVLAPGGDATAAIAGDPEVARVIAFTPRVAPDMDGWRRDTVTAMGFAGPLPAWPETAAEVDVDALREARGEAEFLQGMPSHELAQMRALQERQAAVGRLFAVVRDGRPLAWAQVLAAVIDDVYVVPDARGTGLGRAVVTAAMAAGGRWLVVDDANAPAVGLYRSLGFVDAGRVVQLTRAG